MKKQAILSVNIAVLLFGLAGLFAKWVRLPAICITFGRVVFSSAALGLYMLSRKQKFRVTKRDALRLLLAGAILALHWWSFL
ncbi:MAG: EamA family transporter, partial [Clostridia bacterium]|nr:EamA family transporter [Clostridia bacterium]